MREEPPAAAIVIASPRRLETHQFAEGRIDYALAQVFGGIAETIEIFLRQVNSATCSIFAEVAQDIRQLKRNAGVLGMAERCYAMEAPDVNARQADDRGDVVAVISQF